MVADFMLEARRLIEDGVTAQSLDAVGRLLARASSEPGFVPDVELESLHGGAATSKILQSDPDGLTLMLGRFPAAAETPVHDHNSWGVACVVSGIDNYRHWELDDEGALRILYERRLEPGQFVTWLDPPRDIHSQQGVGGDAVELVLFGKNVMSIPRRYFDPKTKEVRTALP